jgi:hypothetical protein
MSDLTTITLQLKWSRGTWSVERSEAEPKAESERNGKVSGTKPRRKESNKAWMSQATEAHDIY